MNARARAILALVAVFALGAATGVFAARFHTSHTMAGMLDGPPEAARRRWIVWALDRKLDLTTDQRTRIEAILDAHADEFSEIGRSMEPKVSPMLARTEAEIRATLTEDQKPRFDELAQKFEARRRRAMGLP